MMNTTLLYAPSIPGTCIYFNIDGVVQMNTGLSIVGGAIRDETGKWIFGYNRFLRKSSVLIAELWGILDGLLLLQKQGHDGVLISSDNLEENSRYFIPRKRWFLRHIRREDNQVADTLAKMAFANKEELCLFEGSPLAIQETLEVNIAKGSLFPSSTLVITNEPFIPKKRVDNVIVTNEDEIDIKMTWDKLEATNKGTSRVKESKINLITLNYELFKAEPDEGIKKCLTASPISSMVSRLLGKLMLTRRKCRC
ncbi:hypothetical protein Gotri_006093 [Gossypium trilobum]|uniref:RNase H type-1 domain-containing protein n=1 Tax=Gossypium trilobum TaxID=34281 RepID=A0A7J9EYT7_9ROSI|nr:hypothetical protein [Gossypium trilobum]